MFIDELHYVVYIDLYLPINWDLCVCFLTENYICVAAKLLKHIISMVINTITNILNVI